jgi:predicted PurR-regulated permease PerM
VLHLCGDNDRPAHHRYQKAPLIALLIALFDLFPIVGAGLILFPWAIISFIQGNIIKGIGLAALYLVVIIARQILEPKVIGRQVGLPPLVTLICMFVGTSLFGALGLFGLPIAAAIIVSMNNDPEVPITIFKRIPQEAPAGKKEKHCRNVVKKP